VVVLGGALLATGCATKKYVQQTADPIQAKLDKVGDQANKQGTSLEEARKDIERHEVSINNVKEQADGADARAGDALKKAGEAGQAAAAKLAPSADGPTRLKPCVRLLRVRPSRIWTTISCRPKPWSLSIWRRTSSPDAGKLDSSPRTMLAPSAISLPLKALRIRLATRTTTKR
jgi:hypothetical protein